MLLVIQVCDGVVFFDICVGIDSYILYVDVLGVIVIGVGGLEVENVMFGCVFWMCLLDIVGVELSGCCQLGIIVIDVVLVLIEFLCKQKVVGVYLEFYGEGVFSLIFGDCVIIFNMVLEYGVIVVMFVIDQQIIDYLCFIGCDDEQVVLVEVYVCIVGFWVDSLVDVEYEWVLKFDLFSVVCNMVGLFNLYVRVVISELVVKGIVGNFEWVCVEEVEGLMLDGVVIIVVIISCINISNLCNVIVVGLLVCNVDCFGLVCKLWVKILLVFGFKVVIEYLCEVGLLLYLEVFGFGVVVYVCMFCNGMFGVFDLVIQQEIVECDLYVIVVFFGNCNFDGCIYFYVKQVFFVLLLLVVVYVIVGIICFDIECDVFGVVDGKEICLKDFWLSDEEIDVVVRVVVKFEQFCQVYILMFDIIYGECEKVDLFYVWCLMSIYICCLLYWEGVFVGECILCGMCLLVVLLDNIIIDYLLLFNVIFVDSVVGEYLVKMGLFEEDFNFYVIYCGDYFIV